MPAASFGDDNSKVIYGRESDKKEIIDLLLSNDANGRKLSVILLLANDSMGKTTLAWLIYKDHRVTEHFDLKAWAYVSDLSDKFMVTKAVFGRSLYSLVISRNKICLNLKQNSARDLRERDFYLF